MVTPAGPHRPVLLQETLDLLRPGPGAVVVDACLGPGGHAEAFLEAVGPEGRVYGIDRDPGALRFARNRLARFGDRFLALRGDHRDLSGILQAQNVFTVNAVLADLGISSLQLDDPERGFAFSEDGPLDMRLDPETGPTAADLLATLSEDEIRDTLLRYGEEKKARAIARAIVRERETRPLLRTRQLAELVERVAGPRARKYKIHPATRTFQAIRLKLNESLEGLEKFVHDAVSLLRRGGRIAVISFHSLEDRTIKTTLRSLAERCICPPKLPVCGCGREDLIRIVTTRPVRPSPAEVEDNPRSRSARLRVAERL